MNVSNTYFWGVNGKSLLFAYNNYLFAILIFESEKFVPILDCGILNKKIDFQLSKTNLNIVTILYILQYVLIISNIDLVTEVIHIETSLNPTLL